MSILSIISAVIIINLRVAASVNRRIRKHRDALEDGLVYDSIEATSIAVPENATNTAGGALSQTLYTKTIAIC